MTSKPYVPPRVDRTEEFFRCVELFSEGKVVPKRYSGRHEAKGLMLDAENLNRQINFIDGQLQKLGKLVHKGGMFDNTTKEVNDLTAICKAQLERCNNDLKTLQQHGTVNVNQTTAQHFKILVDSLRRLLSDHGKKFKELLESRSEVLSGNTNADKILPATMLQWRNFRLLPSPRTVRRRTTSTAAAVLLQRHVVVDCVNARVCGNLT